MTGDILELVGSYSLGAILIAAVLAAALFVAQKTTEKAIASEFDRRGKQFALGLERRSRFEEMVLIERYETVSDILSRLTVIVSNLNRRRHGTEVEGLMRGNDIVPLTEVFELLAAKQHVLTQRFHPLLFQMSGTLIYLANHKSEDGAQQVLATYKEQLETLQAEITAAFGLDRIAWDTDAQMAVA